jgi:hypothetical protein
VAVKSIKWRTPAEAGTSFTRHLLSTADRIGLKAEAYGSSEKSFGWSVVPVQLDAVKPGLTPFVALGRPQMAEGHEGPRLPLQRNGEGGRSFREIGDHH